MFRDRQPFQVEMQQQPTTRSPASFCDRWVASRNFTCGGGYIRALQQPLERGVCRTDMSPSRGRGTPGSGPRAGGRARYRADRACSSTWCARPHANHEDREAAAVDLEATRALTKRLGGRRPHQQLRTCARIVRRWSYCRTTERDGEQERVMQTVRFSRAFTSATRSAMGR